MDNFMFPPATNFIFPPGYQFSPMDEELVVHYLSNKILNNALTFDNIVELNLYDYDPQELYDLHMREGETAMYFLSPREPKYLHGNRPKRKAGRGYWKACGIGSPIKINNIKVASKRVLLYYTGDNKNSVKTNWIMYEYVMEQHSIPAISKPDFNRHSQIASTSNAAPADNNMKLDDWVLCKVYKKAWKSKKNEPTSGNDISELQVLTDPDKSTSSTASVQKNIDEVNLTHHHTDENRVGYPNFAPQLMPGTHQDHFASYCISGPPPVQITSHSFGSTSDAFSPIGLNFPASSISQPICGSHYIPGTRFAQPFMQIHQQNYGCTNTVPAVGSSSRAPAMEGTSGDVANSAQNDVAGSSSSAPLVQRSDDQCTEANSEPVDDNYTSVFFQLEEWHHPHLPSLLGEKSDSPPK